LLTPHILATLPIQDFNELFNSSKEVRKLNIKGGTIHLHGGNVPVILCTHHKADVFSKNYDESFRSRFACWIDLDKPLIFPKKEGCPPPESKESQEQYLIRLKSLQKGYVEDKPLFPLNCYSTSNSKLKQSRIEAAIYDDPAECPCDDPLKITMTQNMFNRKEILLGNPLSESWATFPEISHIKASYLSHKALINLADKLWYKMTAQEREDRFPLRTKRSLIPENIERYGLIFKHQDFKEDALRPSVILQFPDLIESPQAVAWTLLFQDESILRISLDKSTIKHYKKVFGY